MVLFISPIGLMVVVYVLVGIAIVFFWAHDETKKT